MTREEAKRVLDAHGAEFKGQREGVNWYWSKVRQRWIGEVADGQGGVKLTELTQNAGGSCGC